MEMKIEIDTSEIMIQLERIALSQAHLLERIEELAQIAVREETINVDGPRFLRMKEVTKKTGLSCSTIYKRMNEGSFPRSQQVGDRSVRWLQAGKPCIGDFGMLVPLYGHLGRDPVPATLMQNMAPAVYRWVERMNRPEPDICEVENLSEGFLPDDEIPATLIAVLKHLAIDFVPETRAACLNINAWLEAQGDLDGTNVARFVGEDATFEVRGVQMKTWSQPFRFYLLKRVQDEFESLGGADKEAAKALFDAIDMAEILDLKLNREIGRRNHHHEVWLS